MSRSQAKRVPILLLLIIVLTSGACSTGPTSGEIAAASARGQREVDTHVGDPWVSALDHRSLSVEDEGVTPRRIDRLDGLLAPSYSEHPTQYLYIYHPASATADLETIHSELVANLENAGATIVEFEPFQSTPGGGPVVSTGATARLSVDSVGNALTISLSYVEFVEDDGTDFIRHTISINDSSDE